MILYRNLTAVASLVGALALAGPSQAATEIQWWHAMGGSLGEVLAGLADDFNKSQT